MANEVNTRISHKRDTEANWLANNPILLNGEMALVDLEDGNIQIKIGNGIDAFDKLQYILSDGASGGSGDSTLKPALNTLTENFNTHKTESEARFGNIENNVSALSDEFNGKLEKKASLDENGIILKSALPSYVDDVIEATINSSATQYSSSWLKDASGATITPEKGKIYIITSEGTFYNKQYRWGGSTYALCNPSDVNSVNGKTGIVNLTASDVGAETAGCETRVTNWAQANCEQVSNRIQDVFSYTTSTTTYPSSKATYDIVKFVYDLVMPVAVYDNASGFESNNTDPGDSWQLTGLNLGQFKRLKFYVMSAESGSTQSPSHIVEMHLDDRCRGDNGYFTAGHTAIFPESEARTHNVIFTVNAEKTAICFSKCHRISASTAATSSGGRKCYLIEGYYI